MDDSMESSALKRKRTPDTAALNHQARRSDAVKAGIVPAAKINYLTQANKKLRLLEGGSDTFGDILSMLDDYEGVLLRNESLAANLGAKLVGPLLLKSFEKLFDGPIKVTQLSYTIEQSPVTWLDVVSFSRTNPADLFLTEVLNGQKVCRFWIKGGQVEISEDDYRLIMSGAPERMIPNQTIAEDESAELGTLNILENRLGMLIKKADAVASKARQLNYQLRGRKTAVIARKGIDIDHAPIVPNSFSPQPFAAVNAARSPAPQNGESKLQQDLLEQFQANDHRHALPSQPRTKAARISTLSPTNFDPVVAPSSELRQSYPPAEDGTEVQNRVIMAARIEKLQRGDTIYPPCDRCRRLKFDCAKHLTACSACTKKHAKCSWKDIQEGEVDYERGQSVQEDGNGFVVSRASPMTGGLADGSASSAGSGFAVAMDNGFRTVKHEAMRGMEGQRGMREEMDDQEMLTRMAAAAANGQ